MHSVVRPSTHHILYLLLRQNIFQELVGDCGGSGGMWWVTGGRFFCHHVGVTGGRFFCHHAGVTGGRFFCHHAGRDRGDVSFVTKSVTFSYDYSCNAGSLPSSDYAHTCSPLFLRNKKQAAKQNLQISFHNLSFSIN